jgi:hypothetical protein
MNKLDIEEALNCFTGTNIYHRHEAVGNAFILLTDGSNYVRETCESYWLFDLMLSYQKQLKPYSFQVWHLKRIKENEYLITCEDGNERILVTQKIPFSDFPLDEIKIWLIDGVALLPSEY